MLRGRASEQARGRLLFHCFSAIPFAPKLCFGERKAIFSQQECVRILCRQNVAFTQLAEAIIQKIKGNGLPLRQQPVFPRAPPLLLMRKICPDFAGDLGLRLRRRGTLDVGSGEPLVRMPVWRNKLYSDMSECVAAD